MTEKQAVLLLWYITNASPSAFWKLFHGFQSALSVLDNSVAEWKKLGIHASHIKRFQDFKENGKPEGYLACLQAAKAGEFEVLFFTDTCYPNQFDVLTHKPPLLFVKGNKQILNQAQVSMVGTRKPTKSAQEITENFARKLAEEGLWITSGLAEGIDKHAHLGALQQGKGRTIAVLGNGINTCYPKQNMALYQQIITQGGAIISELLPHTPPQAHNFPRRNRLVSGLGIATVVMEAALKSGSLITAGFAAEQGKLVFAMPGHIYNNQAKGCHHLIREGAILVSNPEQIIEDINLPRRIHHDAMTTDKEIQVLTDKTDKQKERTESVYINNMSDIEAALLDQPQQTQKQNTTEVLPDTQQDNSDSHETQQLPEHLIKLVNQLDWTGQDMDKLIDLTQLDTATLSSQLMELELHGLVVQTGGLYVRCRP